jgi:hypothetical protein
MLGYRRKTSTPGRPQTIGIAERSVREALEVARTLLRHAGAPRRWWSRALRHYCFLYNVTRPPGGGQSPWEMRFGQAFAGPVLTFGSEISYKSAVSDPSGPGNKFGTSSKQGILLGCFMNPGGAWSKDFFVFDLEAVRDNKDCRRIRNKRCGEVFQKRGLPNFPMLTMEAQDDLVPPTPAATAPELLMSDDQPAAGDAPVEAEAEPAVGDAPPKAEAEPPSVKIEQPARGKVPAKGGGW